MKDLFVLLCLLGISSSPFYSYSQCPTLVWSDEFDGESLNESDWNFQTGDGCDIGICGWGNNELQYYQRQNVAVSDGILRITARRETVGGKQYTSARINTKNKQDFRYGRIEARMKLPAGRGLWPAFWMLPTDEVYGGWPQSGEIDIMEFIGREPTEVLGTIHYGNPFPQNQFQGEEYELLEGKFPEEFHEFAIEWSPNKINWFVDDILYSTKTRSDVSPFRWPFDQDFHILLNLAIGGNLGGNVDNTIFPVTMEVDYVRVYDMNRPYISGDRIVGHMAAGEPYQIGSLPDNATVNWTVPEGATIVSGQGTADLIIDWGTEGGTITADISSDCGDQSIQLDVEVESPFFKAFSFENFDAPPNATLDFHSGMHSEVSNPDPNEVNASALSGRYQRDGGEQFDVLFYNVTTINNADAYVRGDRRIFVDVYTSAPIGTLILLQLETASSQPTNFPTGRHSRFQAVVEETDNWHRLEFEFLDQPDGFAPSSGIAKMVLLFAPNTRTSDVYYYDNLDSYSQDATNPVRPNNLVRNHQLQIAPNPVDELIQLQIDGPGAAEYQVDLFSADGRHHTSYSQRLLPAGIHRFDLPTDALPPGVYFLRFRSGGEVQTLRVVKQ